MEVLSAGTTRMDAHQDHAQPALRSFREHAHPRRDTSWPTLRLGNGIPRSDQLLTQTREERILCFNLDMCVLSEVTAIDRAHPF